MASDRGPPWSVAEKKKGAQVHELFDPASAANDDSPDLIAVAGSKPGLAVECPVRSHS